MKQLLANLPFVGSISFWCLMMQADLTIFEAHGPYQRRTNRTRTTILTKEGPLDISIPVYTSKATLYKDTMLNYEKNWEKQLMYALRTAYNPSPFFEYMEDDFYNIINKHHKFLWDFNIDILQTTAKLANIDLNYCESQQFITATPQQDDIRINIETKYANLLDEKCNVVEYHQPFSQPYTSTPFTPWLSMLDLLFNMGPESRNVLRAMRS